MKAKTISVRIFQKGDLVQHLSTGKIGKVISQSGLNTRMLVPFAGTIERLCVEFKPLTKTEYDKLLPKKLKVRSLNRTLSIENGKLIAGCQTLTKNDALKVAAFINKYLK